MVRRGHLVGLVSLVVFGFGVFTGTCSADGLMNGYYSRSCPLAETIVKSITWARVAADPSLAAKALRVQFHDCFVRGCDASVLLDSVGNTQSEKEAGPNQPLAGFDVYDMIKQQLELACPGIVSCADIVALVARDAVSVRFGRPLWEVPTGRRDGVVSLASEVTSDQLPSPFSNFPTLKKVFAGKGLDVMDLVALSGAHTIGVAHCGSFSRRLYNFTGQGDADPALDPTYADALRKSCPDPSDPATTVEMDPRSSLSFDTRYFTLVNKNKGLFQSDAALLTDPTAAAATRKLQNPRSFFSQFGASMEKMGAIGVLTGNAGQIRRQCRVVN